MKKSQARLRMLIFLAVLIVPTLVWGVLNASGAAEKLDYSTGEKRSKHEIAADADAGNITAEAEAWYNDRVPFRSVLLSLNKNLNSALERPYKNGIEKVLLALANAGRDKDTGMTAAAGENTGGNEAAGPETGGASVIENSTEGATQETAENGHVHDFALVETVEPDYDNYGFKRYACACGEEKRETVEKLVDDSYLPLKLLGDEAIEGRRGWLFYIDSYSDYQGTNLMTEEEMSAQAVKMVGLRDLCAANGSELIFAVYPNKNSVYPEYMPTCERAERRKVQIVSDYIHQNTDLHFYYYLDEIVAAKPKHQLYYKLDSHWNAYGAIEGARALFPVLGLPPLDDSSIHETAFERESGDLISLAGVPESDYPRDMDYELNYKADVANTLQILSHDNVQEWVSAAPDGRTLVIVGDSFGPGLLPYLCCEFNHIYYIERDNLDFVDSSIIKSADTLIVEMVERRYYQMTHIVEVLTEKMG